VGSDPKVRPDGPPRQDEGAKGERNGGRGLKELEGASGSGPASEVLADAVRYATTELKELQGIEKEIERRAQTRLEILLSGREQRSDERRGSGRRRAEATALARARYPSLHCSDDVPAK
jgi:hypothetical protein